MKHDTALSTLQARTLVNRVKKCDLSTYSIGNLEHIALDIVNALNEENEKIFPRENNPVFMAFTLSQLLRKAYHDGIINLYNYIALYAAIKQRNAEILKDKGAFGDLYEILVRIALIKVLAFVRPSSLTVAQYGKIDINSKKFGLLEIGNNGKTFTQGTIDDYMEGEYTSIIYGMFSDIDKRYIYELCMDERIEQAIEEIKKRSAYWQDKYQFQEDFNHLGYKGKEVKGITIKSGKVMTQATEQMYYNFIDNVTSGKFCGLNKIL